LIGEPARAAILEALIREGFLPAGELARRAVISAGTASAYLVRLVAGGLIVQPGTIRTEMTERQQKFELPEYAPLVRQYAGRFARYRQRRAPSAEQIATEIADLLDRGSLPLRVPVGLRSERLFARLSPSLLGRLVRSPYKW
jgi:DNA-binding transcriptional ArsR family regulator